MFGMLNQKKIRAMKLDELTEYYLERKQEGMSFSTIRIELEEKNISNNDIKFIIREIDDKLLTQISESSEKMKTNSQLVIGVFLFSGGMLASLGTYLGWINMGNYFIVAYGPIFVGLGMIVSSKRGRTKIFERKNRIRR